MEIYSVSEVNYIMKKARVNSSSLCTTLTREGTTVCLLHVCKCSHCLWLLFQD